MLHPDPNVNDHIVRIIQRRTNEMPQYLMPPADADFDAARREIEEQEDGERWDGMS
jgi:hypothetical protein